MTFASAEEAKVDRQLRRAELLFWLHSPIDWALVVLDFLWMAPIAVLQIMRFAKDPTWINGAWIAVGLIVTSLNWSGIRQWRILLQIESMGRSLRQLQPFKAETYKLDDFVEKPMLDAIRSTWPPESAPLFVRLSRIDSDERIYCPLSAYNMSPMGMIVFTPYSPAEMSILKQFWILHEVGHGEFQNVKQLERPRMAVSTGLFLIFWIFLTTDYGFISLDIILTSALSLGLIFRIKYLSDCKAETRLVDAEILADNYALLAIASPDIERLEISRDAECSRVDGILQDFRDRVRRKPSLVLPPDRSLSEIGRKRRLSQFLANVESLQAGGDGDNLSFVMMAQPWLMILYIALFAPLARVPQVSLTAIQGWSGAAIIVVILTLGVVNSAGYLRRDMATLRKGISDGVLAEATVPASQRNEPSRPSKY